MFCLHPFRSNLPPLRLPVYPGPHLKTLARSLPVPKGTIAQGGLEQRESWPTLSRHCNTQPIVPSPPHTRILYFSIFRKTYKLKRSKVFIFTNCGGHFSGIWSKMVENSVVTQQKGVDFEEKLAYKKISLIVFLNT